LHEQHASLTVVRLHTTSSHKIHKVVHNQIHFSSIALSEDAQKQQKVGPIGDKILHSLPPAKVLNQQEQPPYAQNISQTKQITKR